MQVIKAMTDKERELFATFKIAIEAERSAQAMYQKAVDLCEEPALKSILIGFYDDEVRHEKEVSARYLQYKAEFGIESA